MATEYETADDEAPCLSCGLSLQPPSGVWVQCDECERWLHLECSGLKRTPKEADAFECNECVVSRVQARKRDASLPQRGGPLRRNT